MSEHETQYLPIRYADGRYIANPGRMFIAAAACTTPKDILATYEMMQAEAELGGEMTEPASILCKKLLEKDRNRRLRAGYVVFELIRIGTQAGAPATFRAAAETVSEVWAGDHRGTEAAFQKYRAISHYLAVWAVRPDLAERVETDAAAAEEALGLARGVQIFLMSNYETESWNMVCVPEQIPAITNLSVMLRK